MFLTARYNRTGGGRSSHHTTGVIGHGLLPLSLLRAASVDQGLVVSIIVNRHIGLRLVSLLVSGDLVVSRTRAAPYT